MKVYTVVLQDGQIIQYLLNLIMMRVSLKVEEKIFHY